MLEQIHATAEDERKTHLIVALGLVVFGVYTLASATLGGWTALTTVGVMIGTAGAAMLQWALNRATLKIKRFA